MFVQFGNCDQQHQGQMLLCTRLSNYREIESSAALIESLTHATKKGGKGVDPIQKSLINVKAQLQTAEEKITELEESLKEAEEAAR